MMGFLLLFLALTFAPLSFAIDPVYSLPGNTSILALFDLHTTLDASGVCSDPDIHAIEKAFSIVWASKNNETGLILYDTCGSSARAINIIRQLFLVESHTAPPTPNIAGILSYTSDDVRDVISSTVKVTGLLDVTLGTLTSSGKPSQNVYVDMASTRKIDALVAGLQQLNWTYITVISDDRSPMAEMLYFFEKLKETNICIQYSSKISQQGDLLIQTSDIKTQGIVVFTADLQFAADFKQSLPARFQVVIVTGDATPPEDVIDDSLILSETFDINSLLTEYLTMSILTNDDLMDIKRSYFGIQQNCSYNETEGIVCNNTDTLLSYFSVRTAERDIQMTLAAYSFLQASIGQMVSNNCTQFTVEGCPTLAEILSGQVQVTSEFVAVQNNELTPEPTVISLSWVSAGKAQKIGEYSTADVFTLFPASIENITIAGNQGIPGSSCAGWCPDCTACKNGNTYVDKFMYTAGDLILAGLFPFREKGEQPLSCGDYALQKYPDVYAEAFMFTLDNFRARFPYLLPNVSVGALVLDSCSDTLRIRKTILDFETCGYTFPTTGNQFKPSPKIVGGYFVQGDMKDVGPVSDDVKHLNKLGAIVSSSGDFLVSDISPADSSADLGFTATFDLIALMKWSYVGVVVSKQFSNDERMRNVYEMAKSMNVCISYFSVLDSANAQSVIDVTYTVKNSSASAVVIMATGSDLKDFFSSVSSVGMISRTWLLCDNGQFFREMTDLSLPLGAILFENRGNKDRSFDLSYPSIHQSSTNIWTNIFKLEQNACTVSSCRQRVSGQEKMVAVSVIKSVDAALHALHGAYVKLCPDLEGLCSQFAADGFKSAIEEVTDVEFLYQSEEIIRFTKGPDDVYGAYEISNFQNSGFKTIGVTQKGQLTVDPDLLHYYSYNGDRLSTPRDSVCYSTCACVNINTTTVTNETIMHVEFDEEMDFQESSAMFNTKLWSIIVIVIAGSGCLVTLFMVIYIMCKVCSGSLVRRYLVLGLMLLLAIIFLFLSVLPFLFSPSEAVCGMRFFAHGFAFAFCYGLILCKLTSIRNYKHIGLGGEISRVNQLMSVFFIAGIQIAIGVQWWVLQRPMSVEQVVPVLTGNVTTKVTYYACNLDRTDFVAYHSYVLLLVFMCCVYSIFVRNENQNMRESRLLMVSSWICLALWIAEIVVILVLRREWFELIVCVGILANALTILVVVYLPKINAISKLKYEVSEKRNQNGYKVDTDFHYERPYSLPGTMHSSITDKGLSYPRSLAAFDTSLSY